ncbi:M24 family metallopeptidase [Tianweitania sediminis]|jgi:Xaa-Pro dipeptidase|uniref:Aminopeptidase P family protein n=1 Tax=Tianweitania sediminis TaxID=1502156 RepID=A0A8J7RJ22_9HYPH|nr:Xaa-Pro peptidase family protein [Tianweitania sediminis]MBP0439346.1 aminopeptidase P family protein [Tianweitania sediminis]HEV7417974.1 Xaa-Pro peptidase family protein [Tianweitania sediminis]
MALHFEQSEFDARRDRLLIEMGAAKLDAMLLFAQESMYWLTGFDTFGYCFFQCLVLKADGSMVLLTRSADLRQARHTSTIDNIVLWTDRADADPTLDLRNLLNELDLLGAQIGVEYDTHGLTGFNGRRVDEQLQTFGKIKDASKIIPRLRQFKSQAEVKKAERAAQLGDDALDAALPLIKAGGDEGAILAAMQGAIFAGGGDYPANEFIIGSGADALLCRYKAGRRKLGKQDQLTLEWAGVYHHYHAPVMKTVLTGRATKRHVELFEAARDALLAVEATMMPGKTFGDVFDAHAKVMESYQLTKHRLNACGYSVGARFSPSWMDTPMFYSGNGEQIAADMTLFAHMIIMDSETETAMTLGRTYVTTDGAPRPLSRHGLDLIVQS